MKINCANCKKEVNRSPTEIAKQKNGRGFCSRSCSAIFNNKAFIKRLSGARCACGKKIHPQSTYCQECYNLKVMLDFKTLNEATAGRSGAAKYINIRKAARRIYLASQKPKCCFLCKYRNHFEVCHIKAISEFEKTALISEVNSLNNLIALCPNHHWELDHGLLKVGRLGVEPSSNVL
jgi:HNH endonuclease